METVNKFIENLTDENRRKTPVAVYGVKEMSSVDIKLVTNTVNRTNQYYCAAYYKPVTQIIDLEMLRLKKSEED